ncbi:serine protease [Catellatospora sp. NPDC049111]|uniref:S1 family peptidase n=1 Tax=Catellatospora sp. NPDC049111 TaxID=3155271 RepID=UPI0033E36FC0
MRFASDGTLEHTPAIEDHVVPLASVVDGEVRILGSAFLIGTRGYALTARHCVPNDIEHFKVLFATDRRAVAVEPIAQVEHHPTEDVSLLRFTTVDAWWGMLRLDCGQRNPGEEFEAWGYPEVTYTSTVVNGRLRESPQMVYDRGYIRRWRDRQDLPKVKGDHLYELSTRPGAGYSGSPICAYEPNGSKSWQVIGVYIGEQGTGQTLLDVLADGRVVAETPADVRIVGSHRMHYSDSDGGVVQTRLVFELSDGHLTTKAPGPTRVVRQITVGGAYFGYAARAADFGSWVPSMLGHSLFVEANPAAGATPLRLGPQDIVR